MRFIVEREFHLYCHCCVVIVRVCVCRRVPSCVESNALLPPLFPPPLVPHVFYVATQNISSLRRIRCLSDANPTTTSSGHPLLQECVIQWEPKKAIRSRIGLIVQTFLRNVDCVRDVHTTLMTLVLRATLEVLAVEVWCPELRSTVQSEFRKRCCCCCC